MLWSEGSHHDWYITYRHDYRENYKARISIACVRAQLFQQIQARQVQISNSEALHKIKGTVKLTKRVKLKPNQSLKVSGKGNHPLNTKPVNVTVEPLEDNEDSYTVPAYTFLKSNSKRVLVGLRNMSCRTVTLHKGTVIARLSPTNVVPHMMAPELGEVKLASCQLKLPPQKDLKNNKLELNPELIQISKINDESTDQGQIDKLFSKLDLSGCDHWTEEQQQQVRDCIIKHHKIFAVEHGELGKTNLVKHTIKLDNYVAFKERYRHIPPHQYDEVKKHLSEMWKWVLSENQIAHGRAR